MTRSFALLVNPTAAGGRALRRVPAVVEELARHGAAHRVVETRSIEHAEAEARTAVAAGEVVASLGGDGFLRPLAGVVAGGETPLAILPGGRGNDFARVLGIPSDPAEAARVAVEGEEQAFDIAEVNGTPYVGIASLGFDSDVNRLANETRFIRGNLVYLSAALRALVAWKPASFSVEVDGERLDLRGWSVAVANSRAFGGGMFLAPHAVLDDGLLDVVAVSEGPKLRYLRGLAKVFKGKHLDDPSVTLMRGAEVRVSADRPFDIYADGDAVARVPATMTVRKRALRVIVPRRA